MGVVLTLLEIMALHSGSLRKVQDKILLSLKCFKSRVPEPGNLTMDFLMEHSHYAKKYHGDEHDKMSVVTGNNTYPTINK